MCPSERAPGASASLCACEGAARAQLQLSPSAESLGSAAGGKQPSPLRRRSLCRRVIHPRILAERRLPTCCHLFCPSAPREGRGAATLPLGLQAPLGAGPPAALHLVLCPPPPAARPHPKSRRYPPAPLSPAVEGAERGPSEHGRALCSAWRSRSGDLYLISPACFLLAGGREGLV